MPTDKKDLEKLTKLGGQRKVDRMLEAFPNHGGGNMEIVLHCTEFTCRCPLTSQPDYAEIEIAYVPDKYIVESKSLKLYLETFRDQGVFHEHLAVDIGTDFVKYIKPKNVAVTVRFNTRGGIAIDATWSNKK